MIEIIPEEVRAKPEAHERIGEERTFEVDLVQPKLVKRETVRLEVPPEGGQVRLLRSLRRGRSGPSWAGMPRRAFIAWVALSKYVDHLPLYRLEQMSPRWGASISRQTMSDWIEVASDWLEPIYRRMLINLRAGGYLQADETPIRCHDPDEKEGSPTPQGWLWDNRRPGGDVVFEWRLSRRHDELNTLLADYKGILQSDAYQAYPNYAENHEGVIRVGCWGACPAQALTRLSPRRPRRRGSSWNRSPGSTASSGGRTRRGLAIPGCDPGCGPKNFARTPATAESASGGCRANKGPALKSLLGKACDYLLSYWDPPSDGPP